MYLTFICRDNEDVIAEMIESCLPIVDGIIVCDTGSKDKTLDVIKKTLKTHNEVNELAATGSKVTDYHIWYYKQLYIYEDKWVNFGHNRTLMMEHCRKHPEADYLLVMDSDEILVIKPDFKTSNIKNDCIMINTPGDAYTYPRDRIFSNKIHWAWQGAAHEFPHSKEMKSKNTEENLYLKLRPKPAGYDKHIRRNLKLLLEDLKKEPNDARTNFYVGLSYRDLGQPEEARKYLLIRSVMEKTWDEERWYAKYILAIMSEISKEYDRAKLEYLNAYEFRPTRAEPLFKLAKMLYEKKERNQAIMYMRMARNIERPKHDSVFVESSIYSWGCMFELSHMLYYDTTTMEEGYAYAFEVLEERNGAPQNIIDRTYENLRLYDNNYVAMGKPKRFVIELPPGYDGLGDHLLYSHLPALIDKIMPGVPIYVSDFNTYKTGKTKEMVWENNRLVSGFCKARGTYKNMEALVNIMSQRNMVMGMSMMDQIAVFYGLNPQLSHDGKDECLPDIHIKEESLAIKDSWKKKISNKIIFDGNWKHFAGVSQEQVEKYFEDEGIKIDYQIERFDDTNYIELPGVDKIKLNGIYDYLKLFRYSGAIYTLMTGTAILAVASGETFLNVFIGPQNLKNYQFENINNYIMLS